MQLSCNFAYSKLLLFIANTLSHCRCLFAALLWLLWFVNRADRKGKGILSRSTAWNKHAYQSYIFSYTSNVYNTQLLSVRVVCKEHFILDFVRSFLLVFTSLFIFIYFFNANWITSTSGVFGLLWVYSRLELGPATRAQFSFLF